jgi:spore germination protein YaaH
MTLAVRSSAPLALVAAVAALALCAPGGAAALARTAEAGAQREAAPRCARPLALRFVRTKGTTTGVLRWKAPRRLPEGVAGYRVLRNGKVVGQTRSRALPVRFTPGRKLVLVVRVALRNGTTLPCRARLVRTVAWIPPGAPVNLSARPTETGVLLQWEPAKAGDGKLSGYRVLRDGVAVRQSRATSLEIALPSLRTFRFTVVAVDTRGRQGFPSKAVTFQVGHVAPSDPVGLTGEAVSDREVALAWQPSAGRGSARVFYRVLRDGRTVLQTRETGARVTNLAPATTYRFEVVAVDSLGYASRSSGAVSVTTRPPEPSTGAAHVFLLASTDRSFEAFQQRYRQIGTVYPTYFECLADGRMVGRDDPLITGWARLRGVKIHARIDCQNTQTLNTMLRSQTQRQQVIDFVVGVVGQYGYDGANLDFEAGLPVDRNVYTSFVAELASRLHAAGKELSVDVSAKVADVPNHPRSTFYDYDALSQHADTIFVMAWGIHWRTSAPGAIDDWTWVTRVADYVSKRPRRERYVLGFGMFGFDWANGGGTGWPATPLEHEDVLALAHRVGATPQWDDRVKAPFFTYTDGAGDPHQVWFTNARSIGLRVELARSTGLGIGLWRLGREDAGIWEHPMLQPGVAWS